VSADASIVDVLEGRARWCVVTGDCLQVLPTLPDKSVAHVIADAPYSEAVHSKQWVSAALTAEGKPRASSKHREIDFAPITEAQVTQVCRDVHRISLRWFLAFADIEETARLWREGAAIHGLDSVRTCIWDKVDSSPQFTGDRPASACEAIVCSHQPGRKRWNGGGRRNLFSHAVNGERGDKPHPTTKPISLMVELVELFTDEDEIVADPFCGSGSTGVACLRLGRRFIGIELDPKYAQIARDRLTAEGQGQSLREYRAGQLPMFAEAK
jgi:site-specific DNA-methyltransferase (adenine-specific)